MDQGGQAAAPEEVFEASVTEPDGTFVEYPDGLRIDIGTVQKISNELRNHETWDFSDSFQEAGPGADAYQIDLKLTNGSEETIGTVELGSFLLLLSCPQGENRLPMPATNSHVDTTYPTRLVPGTEVEYSEACWFAPASDAGGWVITVDPSSVISNDSMASEGQSYAPFTFTDVETLATE